MNKISLTFAFIAMSCGYVKNEGANLNSTITESLKETTAFDVSIMYPLETGNNENIYLHPNSRSLKDNLEIIPSPQTMIADVDHSKTKVIGVRLDPCFPKKVNNSTVCEAQIRFVIQGFGDDQAAHVFYPVTANELKETVSEIIQLRKSIQQRENLTFDFHMSPLQLHPLFQFSDFSTKLNQILLSKISSKQISRVTTTLSPAPDSQWAFKGFDLNQNVKKPIAIPGIKQTANVSPREEINLFFSPDDDHSIDFDISNTSDISYLIKTASKDFINASTAVKDKIRKGVIAAYQIENPDVHSPETVDCVSCHVSLQARKKSNFVIGNENFAQHIYKSKSGMNLSLSKTNNLDFHNMRLFGHHRGISISQRTINETDSVVHYLKTN